MTIIFPIYFFETWLQYFGSMNNYTCHSKILRDLKLFIVMIRPLGLNLMLGVILRLTKCFFIK